MISNADPELEQLVHTHRTSYQSCWPRGLGELNPIPISRIFFSVSVDSSPRSHLFTPVILPWQSEHLSVHTAPKWWHWIYLICDVPLLRSVLRSSIRAVITVLMCEQRPYPVWFSRLRKSDEFQRNEALPHFCDLEIVVNKAFRVTSPLL